MQLKGSKYRMDRKRKMRRSNAGLVVLLLALIGLVMYFNQFVIEDLPMAQVNTPTPSPIPESLEQEADTMAEQGNLIQAIDLYKQAIILSSGAPNLSTLYVKLAHAQILAGEYEEAKTNAENALLLNNQSPQALAELGWAYSFLGETIEAEQSLQQALALNSESVEAHAYYAELLADQGDYDGAAVHSRQALELNSQSLVALRSRGYVLYYTGNYEEAAAEFEQAIAINSRVADLHQFLGLSYWALGNTDQAIESFSVADQFDVDNPLPDTYISRIYLGIGEYAKAAQYAQSAVDNDPANPIRWGNWGVALYKNLQYAEAIEAFSVAIHGGKTEDGYTVQGLTLNYDNTEFYYMYGLALAYTRQCTEALPIFQALIANVPLDETAIANADAGIEVCEEYVNDGTAIEDTEEEEIPDEETTTEETITPTPETDN